MADSGVSLHGNAEGEVDGAGHGDLGQGQDHTDQAQVASVGLQARNSVFKSNGFCRNL